ncbi:metal-dependent phosphohydrolase [Tumebacillus algifaecis]|uniref:bis(5'-nucleosyl)-tetraphosphatase (symmetrical) n=1 Tax=Tumebacillus algifaecis TaxID=1214604 RepID=A0A223CZ72_9BACL|nr:bis(5'-nucleosyl)-tetraphosphatase (symmetrical) YqeK [Tumebacillus algifaecis]ASS74759.1 metal-dependent phosphohydrolase [Tumebacillus algifaecis]
MNELEIKEIIRQTLSPRRFQHVSGVVDAADTLAHRYGVDVEKARLAAWIHDYAREWPVDKWYETAKQRGIDPTYLEVAEMLHGPIAASMMPEVFGIEDEEIADAVRYHTSGRVGMTPLEKVVCLADYIEAGREYPAVHELRKQAEVDLDLALASAFDNTIRFLLDKKQPIFPVTILARNELWRALKDRRTL